jgi:hypothetical protein
MTTIINTFFDKDNVIHSSSVGQPDLIVTPPENETFFGASTLTIDINNCGTVLLQIKAQLTVTTAQQQNCVTNDLFNTAGYYGYFAYPALYGALTSIKQNMGEEQITAWVNTGEFSFVGVDYIVYRTYVPKAYQPNVILNFTR